MISVRLLQREEWEARLRARGCRPSAEGESRKLQTAEWWFSPKGRRIFTVPADQEGRCDHWALTPILAYLDGNDP